MEGIMIKEAAKMLGVESHVLRYWEEELELEIKRNSMGHRYYDERDIRLLSDVKELRERGLTLKDIKAGIEKNRQKRLSEDSKTESENIENKNIENDINNENNNGNKEEIALQNGANAVKEIGSDDKVVDFKTLQMQTLMNKMVANALRENKDIITTAVKSEITEDVMKQFDTVMREQEERQEARYRKLDEYLRQLQNANMEVAATKTKRRFGRKKNKVKL